MTLRCKSLLLIVVLTFALGAVVSHLTRSRVSAILTEDLRATAEAEAMRAARALEADFSGESERRLLPKLNELAGRLGAGYAAALGPAGHVFAHTDVVETASPEDEAFTQAVLAERRPAWRLVTARGKEFVEATVPVWERGADAQERFMLGGGREGGPRLLGLLRLALPLARTRAAERAIVWSIFGIVLLAGLVAFGAALFVANGMIGRLNRLVEAVSRVAHGDYGAQVRGEAPDELGDLARRFNEMSSTLARTTVSKDYLTNILASTQDAVFVTDAAGMVEMVNPAAVRLIGDRPVLGRPLADFLRDDGGAATSGSLDVSLLAAGDKRIPVLVSASGMLDEEGKVSGLVCVAKDITERKQAEAELTFRNALLLAQQEASLDAILVVDVHGKISSFNRRFVELWGIPSDVIESRSDERALQSVLSRLADPGAFLARVQHLYAHPDESSDEEIRLLDGRVLERYSAPVRSGGVNFGRVWYFRDVTDRKAAEDAKILRERDAIQREFVANVSHELRTPITAIKGFAETLRMGALEDAENRLGFVETIERHADRLARLVDNLLTLSVLETGKRRIQLEEIALKPFVRDFAAGFEPVARRANLFVEVDIPESLRAKADPNQLSQVLQNLLDNAIKFSRPGGRVKVAGRLEDGQAVVSVADSGIGIPAKDLPRVFDRFHRADGRAREIKGTGLGLAIAKQIIELHGGRIWAESAEGSGAVFRFTLPAKTVE